MPNIVYPKLNFSRSKYFFANNPLTEFSGMRILAGMARLEESFD